MKRKILTIITIGSIFCMALTGCGDSSYRNSARSETSTLSDVTAESDITTTAGERPDGSEVESTKEAEQEIEEVEIEETENPIGGEAGLYRSDGSFIPWDDLGIDVESDYTGQNRETEVKCPYKVFTDNDYDGHLVLPENISRLGDYTFYACISLTSIDLPDTLLSIDTNAFSGCISLTNIDLPDTLTRIGGSVFGGCRLLQILITPEQWKNGMRLIKQILGTILPWKKSLAQMELLPLIHNINNERCFERRLFVQINNFHAIVSSDL